jgi:membrane protein required for colicin V production
MTALDLAVIAVIVLSGLFAFSRGFVREELSIATWIGASFFTFYAFPFARPLAAKALPPLLSDAVAMFGPFAVAFVVLSVITATIARRVKDSPLSSVDRTLGLIFGLVRGAFLACLGYIALTWLMPAPLPDWIALARTRPLLESGRAALTRIMPDDMRDRASKAASRYERSSAQDVEGAIGALRTPRPAAPPPAPSATPSAPPGSTNPASVPVYTPADQRDLQRLFQQQNAR